MNFDITCPCEWSYLICRDVVESFDLSILLDALEQHVRAENIVLREDVGVAETQIHMRVRRKMEYGVDVVFLQALDDIAWNRHIAVEEAEIRLRLQHARIIQRAAVIELVEGDHVVVVRIFDGQVAYEPGPTFCIFGAGQLSASNWLYQNREFLDSDRYG